MNLKGKKRSSWDTPSNILEPIKSVAFLEEAACGIGDQPSLEGSQMGMQMNFYFLSEHNFSILFIYLQ